MTPIKRLVLSGCNIFAEDWAGILNPIAGCTDPQSAKHLADILMNYHKVSLIEREVTVQYVFAEPDQVTH